MWHNGMIDGYRYSIKCFEDSSDYGIDDGRISKLSIEKDNKFLAVYDRGWDVKPAVEVAKIYKQILKEYN